MAFHLLTFDGLETVASVESFSKRVRIQWSSFAIGSFSFTGIGVLQALREPQKHNPNYKLSLNTNYLPRPRGTTAISFEELKRFAPSVLTSQPIAGVSNRHSLSSHFLNPRTSFLSQRVRLRKVKYYYEPTPVSGEPKNSTGNPATTGPLETARSAEGPGFPRPSGCLA